TVTGSGGAAGGGSGSGAAGGPGAGATQAGNHTATSGGAGISAPTTCAGTQVHGDTYSPPCLSFKGSNGGATSRGVSANQIQIAFRVPADNISSIDSAIQQLAGKYNSAQFSDTEADIERTIQDLASYFNKHFQFYGRKLDLHIFKGQGTLTSEITGGGQSQADADALTDARSIKAFADISAFSQPFGQALSSQHVVNIGSPYMSLGWYQQNAPYAWSFFPNCTTATEGAAAGAVHQLVAQKVTWAGKGVSDGQPRRFAVIAPDNPVYQACIKIVTSAMAAAGHPVADNLSYTANLSELSQESASMQQRLVNDKITTVLCACDPITLIYLTGDLDNASYEPEIINSGGAFTDEDVVSQLFDQQVWAHAAGETFDGATPPFGSSLGYFAAKSVDPSHTPAHEVDILYEDMYILALGIQLAGPNLTPQSFQRGLFSYGGGNGEYGRWSFSQNGKGTWTPQYEYKYEWWNPKAASAFNGQNGAWVVDKNWYTFNQVPSGPPPVFPQGPQ
ncbi:MAG: hypothetical protein ACRDTP_05275, partial [Mycobacteriales bacterium]